MNPEIKAKWVAALRSGEYEQGKHALRDAEQFCCLGVLCSLHAQAHPRIAAKESSRRSYLGSYSTLPGKVMNWAGLESEWGPRLVIAGMTAEATIHNDGLSGTPQATFAQIADAIEAQL